MTVNLKDLSTPDLKKLIEEAGIEYAQRGEVEPRNAPQGAYIFTGDAPMAAFVDGGKFILRLRSKLYGWVNFQISKEGADFLQQTLAKALAAGITPASGDSSGIRH